MTSTFNALDQKFGVAEPTTMAPVESTITALKTTDQVIANDNPELAEVDNDLIAARKSLRSLLDQAQDAATEAMSIAIQSQQPRAFEVASQMVKAASDLASSILDYHKKVKDIKEEEEKKPQKIGTQNVFIGSTSELMKALRENGIAPPAITAKASVVNDG